MLETDRLLLGQGVVLVGRSDGERRIAGLSEG